MAADLELELDKARHILAARGDTKRLSGPARPAPLPTER
jgi:hypothetical protein